MPAAGAISGVVEAYIPQTWDVLLNDPDAHYGADVLQSRIDYVKAFLFGDAAKIEDDEDDYHPLVREYIGKLVVLKLIPAGREYWMNQHTTATTVGAGNETATYPERVQILKELEARLLGEVADDAKLIAELLDEAGHVTRERGTLPLLSSGENADMVTPDPYRWDQDRDGPAIVVHYPPVVVGP